MFDRDFARLGLFLLRDGTWGDRRILPEGWVDTMRTTQAEDPENGLGYGRQTWTVPDGRGTFRMNGYEGQRVICVPISGLSRGTSSCTSCSDFPAACRRSHEDGMHTQPAATDIVA